MEKVKILNCVDIINDSVKYYDGKRPFLSTGDLNISEIVNLDYLTFEEKPSRANLNVSFGDIIMARMQDTTKVYLVDKEYSEIIVSTGFLVLRPKSNVDKKYLFQILLSNDFQNEKDKLCTGATQKAINNANFSKIQIPLPSLPEQKAIAKKLDKAQEIIRYNEEIIAKYDALTQSLFLDMFGDPVKNEKGWEKKELKEFGNISTGNTPSRTDLENYSDNYIEWIKTDNIKADSVVITNASEFLSYKGAQKGRIVRKGALLVACIAGSIDSIGRCALTDRDVSFNQQINAIQPNENINSLFLYCLIKNNSKYIQGFASNGMKRMLSKGEFQKIIFISPPIELQNLFAERVSAIEAQKQLAQKSLAKSQALFGSLLQESFKN